MSDLPSITCPKCLMTSHNPNDVREQFCGNCHEWISDNPTTVRLGTRLDQYLAAAQASADADGKAVPVPGMISADTILDAMCGPEGITPVDRERMRPDAEKLAQGLSIKAEHLLRADRLDVSIRRSDGDH